MPEPLSAPSITARMVKAGADALKGHVAQMGCTCPWDDDGNPPDDCKCGERMERDRWNLAYRVLDAVRKEQSR